MRRRTLLAGLPLLFAAREGTAQTLGGRAAAYPVPAPFGNRQIAMPLWGAAGTANGVTVGAAFSLEGDFDFVRLIHTNLDTSPETLIASVAPSSVMGDGANPVNSSGVVDQTLHVPVTWNGGGVPTDWPSPAGSTRTVSAPPQVAGANAANFACTFVASDWIPVRSLPRSDGSQTPLLFTRMAGQGAGPINVGVASAALGAAPGANPWDAVCRGRGMVGWYAGGDQATTPGAVTPTYAPYFAPLCVEAIGRRRGVVVGVTGDSLSQGAGTTTGQLSPWQIAAWTLSTSAFPVTVAKLGYAGMASANFQAIGMAFAKAYRPDVLIIKAETPNDLNPSITVYEASLARALQMIEWCLANGSVPVLLTAEPWGYSGSAEQARQAFNMWVRGAGYLFVDMDAVLADPASPANILPAFNSGSAPPHYGDAGSAALAVAFQAVLSGVIARFTP